MGAGAALAHHDPQRQEPQHEQVTGSSPSTTRTSILARWQSREFSRQLFCVVRHAERADSVWGVYRDERWYKTDDCRAWPVDPPLSDEGVEGAEGVAQRVCAFAEASDSTIHIVVTSPYLRCVQTAAAIARTLGRRTRLLVDWSLGEVFGPEVMGSTEPIRPVRSMGEVQALCPGVRLLPKAIGAWPAWPEGLRDARRRYADRFLTYLRRGAVARRNFVLVTHADCIGVTLSLMPTHSRTVVQSAQSGALVMGVRSLQPEKSKVRRTRSASIASVVPLNHSISGDEDSDGEFGNEPLVTKVDPWMSERPAASEDTAPLAPPKASDGWQVQTDKVSFCELPVRQTSTRSTVSKRVQSLIRYSHFSRQEIERLLGQLSDRPLGGADKEEAEMEIGFPSASKSGAPAQKSLSKVSLSTYLFGMSSAGSEPRSEVRVGSRHSSSGTRHGSFLNRYWRSSSVSESADSDDVMSYEQILCTGSTSVGNSPLRRPPSVAMSSLHGPSFHGKPSDEEQAVPASPPPTLIGTCAEQAPIASEAEKREHRALTTTSDLLRRRSRKPLTLVP